MEAITLRLEAIASRLEAIASGLEGITLRLDVLRVFPTPKEFAFQVSLATSYGRVKNWSESDCAALKQLSVCSSTHKERTTLPQKGP